MKQAQLAAIGEFHRRVVAHSREVRTRHSFVGMPVLEEVTPEEQLVVLVEEVGKLSRATNKLRIASAPEVRRQWQEEREARLVTIASVAARIASRSA